MGHIDRRPGDTVKRNGLWYRDEDDWRDTVTEYQNDEAPHKPEDDDE
jgi:hypothetical protein